MKKSSKLYTVILGLLFIVLCLFEANSMIFMVYANFSPILAVLRAIIVLLAIYVFSRSPILYKNTLLKCFLFWTIYCWIFCLIGLGGEEKSAVFRIVIFEAVYFVVFYSTLMSEKSNVIIELGVTSLLLIACYYLLQNSLYVEFLFGREFTITNLVFWPLCCVPGIFLIRNNVWRYLLLVIAIIACIFGMKRSALISIFLIIFVFLIHEFIGKNKPFKTKFILLIAGGIGVYVIQHYFSDFIELNLDRISAIESDRGSGRDHVWKDSLNAIENGNILEIIFGSGVDSTWARAHHTTSHNDFLTLFIEFGLVGVILYFIFWIHIIKLYLFTRKRTPEYVMSVIASIVILLVVGSVGDLFTSYAYFPFITAVLGYVDAKCISLRRNYLCKN